LFFKYPGIFSWSHSFRFQNAEIVKAFYQQHRSFSSLVGQRFGSFVSKEKHRISMLARVDVSSMKNGKKKSFKLSQLR